MDYYSIIARNFQETLETVAMSVDLLAGPIEAASEVLAGALLEDRKIICCGNGADAAQAQILIANLLAHYQHERPALPAFALGSDGGVLTAIGNSNGFNDIYSRQLRALGQAGDVLLCINSAENSGSLLRAVQAAHERDMRVVLLSNQGGHELGTLIRLEDVEIRVEAASQARIVELHTMILHNLCELIELRLFGSHHQE